jgi:hypothetical protein
MLQLACSSQSSSPSIRAPHPVTSEVRGGRGVVTARSTWVIPSLFSFFFLHPHVRLMFFTNSNHVHTLTTITHQSEKNGSACGLFDIASYSCTSYVCVFVRPTSVRNLLSSTWVDHHRWKKCLQSRFVKPINPGCSNRD